MQVVQILENAPMLIAKQEDVVAQRTREKKLVKHNLEVARAAATIKGRLVSKNQKVLEAYVEIDEDVQKYEVALIEAETALHLAEIELNELENQFTSARKLASLQITASTIPNVRDRESNGRTNEETHMEER